MCCYEYLWTNLYGWVAWLGSQLFMQKRIFARYIPAFQMLCWKDTTATLCLGFYRLDYFGIDCLFIVFFQASMVFIFLSYVLKERLMCVCIIHLICEMIHCYFACNVSVQIGAYIVWKLSPIKIYKIFNLLWLQNISADGTGKKSQFYRSKNRISSMDYSPLHKQICWIEVSIGSWGSKFMCSKLTKPDSPQEFKLVYSLQCKFSCNVHMQKWMNFEDC